MDILNQMKIDLSGYKWNPLFLSSLNTTFYLLFLKSVTRHLEGFIGHLQKYHFNLYFPTLCCFKQ